VEARREAAVSLIGFKLGIVGSETAEESNPKEGSTSEKKPLGQIKGGYDS